MEAGAKHAAGYEVVDAGGLLRNIRKIYAKVVSKSPSKGPKGVGDTVRLNYAVASSGVRLRVMEKAHHRSVSSDYSATEYMVAYSRTYTVHGKRGVAVTLAAPKATHIAAGS